ncbi:sulfite oxidase heme-binding subunit YedZ [Methylomonas sp. MgM2]
MTIRNLDKRALARVKLAVFPLALLPLAKLVLGGVFGHLGANPIEKISHVTGFWTLTFLLITLSVTPLRRLLGYLWLTRLRRMLGLFAFFYGCLHFLTYLVLDQFFDWQEIAKDIVKRPYITVGFTTFLLMIPLAITSTDDMMRKLGGKRWRSIHRLIYPCAVAGVVHYWWLVKKDLSNPIAFALLLGTILGIRVGMGMLSVWKQNARGFNRSSFNGPDKLAVSRPYDRNKP